MLYDCRRCGACCANPDEYRAEEVVDRVDVGDREPLPAGCRRVEPGDARSLQYRRERGLDR